MSLARSFPAYLRGKAVLVNVDTSNDFMWEGINGKPTGKLPVTGAQKLIDRLNDFFDAVPKGLFEEALALFDTHFEASYPHTDEAALFPPHSLYGTWGWQYAPDVDKLAAKTAIGYFMKPVFGIGGWDSGVEANAGKPEQLLLENEEERYIRTNLYRHGVKDAKAPFGWYFGEQRDDYFARLRAEGVCTAVVTGVATDYCDKFAIEYLLEEGFNVVVLTDLVAGIFTPATAVAEQGAPNGDPQGVFDLSEMIRENDFLREAFLDGSLILTDADTYLRQAKAARRLD